MSDVANGVRSQSMESHNTIREMKLDPVAIRPRLAADDANFSVVLDPADSSQCLGQDRVFRFQLQLVISMLVLAATAISEIFTARYDALRRGLQNCFQPAPQQASLHPFRTDLDQLPW